VVGPPAARSVLSSPFPPVSLRSAGETLWIAPRPKRIMWYIQSSSATPLAELQCVIFEGAFWFARCARAAP